MDTPFARWLPMFVTIGIALLSIAANYGLTKAEVDNLKEKVSSSQNKNENQEDKIQSLQIDRAADHQLLLHISEAVEEIKRDVKEVKRGRRQD